jgi:hypothetical protein
VVRGGGTTGLKYAAQRAQGDVGVPGEMPAVLRRLGARAYGGGTADGPPVRDVRTRTAARASGLLGTGRAGGARPRDGARLGRCGLGRLGRARRRAWRRSVLKCVAGALFQPIFLQKIE